jgi:hypothetical protein
MSLRRGLVPTSREPSPLPSLRKGGGAFAVGVLRYPSPWLSALCQVLTPGGETHVTTQGAACPAAGALGGRRVRSRGADAKRPFGFPIRLKIDS